MKKAEFMALMEPIGDLLEQKSQDYGSGTAVELDRYFPFKHKSYTQMIWTKTLRIISLVSHDVNPKFESLEDSVNDLIAYAAFYKDYLKRFGLPQDPGRKP